MTLYLVNQAIHETLIADTVDKVQFEGPGSLVEVVNRDLSNAIYFRVDGVIPVVAGADCLVVLPGNALQVELAAPIARMPVPFVGLQVQLISAGNAEYSVTAVSPQSSTYERSTPSPAINIVPDSGSAVALQPGTNVVTFGSTRVCQLTMPTATPGERVTLFAVVDPSAPRINGSVVTILRWAGDPVVWGTTYPLIGIVTDLASGGPYIQKLDFEAGDGCWVESTGQIVSQHLYPVPTVPTDIVTGLAATDTTLGSISLTADTINTPVQPDPDDGQPIQWGILYKADSADGPWTPIALAPNPSPGTFTDSDVTDGQRYYYTATVASAGGEGPQCTPVSAVPTGP